MKLRWLCWPDFNGFQQKQPSGCFFYGRTVRLSLHAGCRIAGLLCDDFPLKTYMCTLKLMFIEN
ncbi:hypothetical protein ATY27_12085 [Rheinheimera sp. F8]|nr:hypothetical protein ATY27_04860 [Rheinheimera sp. F8]ALZ76425.1 hypothetical protein ATY27_12085 [Rheinheimera sp. F8]